MGIAIVAVAIVNGVAFLAVPVATATALILLFPARPSQQTDDMFVCSFGMFAFWLLCMSCVCSGLFALFFCM